MSTLGDTGLHIGTSGWMYKDWGEEFYPKDMKKGHLQFLAREFKTVEVNSSFYHLPFTKTFENWRTGTPDDFTFAVKLSRFITHQKKLQGVRLPLDRFIDRAKHLEEKLGVVLIQLPPSLQFKTSLLEKMIEDIRVVTTREGVTIRFALEPRHQSWMDAGGIVRTLLKPENIAVVFPHSRKIPSFEPEKHNVTADFVYVRFHGPSEFAASRYGPARLKPWAERIVEWRNKHIDVFVYFNNDIHGHAIHDARTLIRQIAKRTKR